MKPKDNGKEMQISSSLFCVYLFEIHYVVCWEILGKYESCIYSFLYWHGKQIYVKHAVSE